MINRIVIIFCLLGFFKLQAQDNLSVSSIPQELLENANAVVRYDNFEFEIKSPSLVETRRSWAITILNDKGLKEHGTFKTYYDKLSKVRDIECRLYDAAGNKVKHLRRGDIKDIGLGYSSQEVLDTRVKLASFQDESYDFPYTVEFHYEKESENTMFFPMWYPIRAENTSVQRASFEVFNPQNIKYRFKADFYNSGTKGELVETNINSKWVVENLKAFEMEIFAEDDKQVTIHLAPSQFELEGLKGNLSTWEQASSFYYTLNDGRQSLPAYTKAKVKELTAGLTSNYDKAKALYEYMQSHTRYMSIQLGVGGWQTIPADVVAEKGYGDCKALTNYTVALMREAGIEALPALITAGKNKPRPLEDFPRMNFNHIITCLPMKGDTIWLECTSQTEPFGFVGSFDGNRKALLIKENGGAFVNTRAYTPQENFQNRKLIVDLNEDGSAKLNVNTTWGGIQYEGRERMYTYSSQSEQKEYLLNAINLRNFNLDEYSFTVNKAELPTLTEELKISSRKYVSKSGKRFFVQLNPLSGFYKTPKKNEAREADIYLSPNTYHVQDTDTTLVNLPEGLQVEYLPKSTLIESDFGSYSSSTQREGNQLIYTRKVTMKGGFYPAASYEELYDFLKKINRADRARAVLIVGET